MGPNLRPRWRLLSGSQLRMCIPQPRANWEATAARRQFLVLSYRRRQVAGQRGQRVPQLCEASVCLIFFSIPSLPTHFHPHLLLYLLLIQLLSLPISLMWPSCKGHGVIGSASGCKSHANKVKPKLSRGLCLGQDCLAWHYAGLLRSAC